MFKRLFVFLSFFFVAVFICLSAIQAQFKDQGPLPDWVNDAVEAVKNGILVDPGIQTVCFNSTRPDGFNFKPLGENGAATITITGECPFDSGCDVFRTSEGSVMTTVNGRQKPNANEPTPDPNAPVALGQNDPPVNLNLHLPKGPVNQKLHQSGLKNHHMYFYIGRGTNIAPTGAATTTESPTVQPGNEHSLNQGVLNFNEASEMGASISGQSQQCKFVVWDPYGRIFDSQSLEPIPNAVVTLIDAQTDAPVLQIDPNEDVTLVDGLFNILVGRAGMYKIRVVPPSTHIVKQHAQLASGYDQMYFELYEPETEYEEKIGVPTHHDIAIVPVGNPFIAPFVETMKVDAGVHMGSSIVYKGRVSHPLSNVCLFGEKTRTNYGCDEDKADRFGVYIIFLDINTAPLFERLIPVATKWNESMPNSGPIIGHAFSLGLGYEPILGFIDGYAYNRKGETIPGARVTVKVSESNQIISTAFADAMGYFRIESSSLPITGYYLDIWEPSASIALKKSISQFTNENKTYLTSKNLNLVQPHRINSTTKMRIQKNILPTPIPVAAAPTNSKKLDIFILVIVIGILLLLAVGASLYNFFQKQRTI